MPGLLTDQERNLIAEQVATLILAQPGNLMALLQSHAIRIETANPPIMYGFNVVAYCERSAWVENPALILRLLKRLGHIAEINSIILRIEGMNIGVFHFGNVRDTSLLALDLPFIGREETRDYLDKFLDPILPPMMPQPCRVLVINGKTKSGKTFTFDYIRYINSVNNQNRFQTIFIDYKSFVGREFGPIELAENVISLAGGNPNKVATLKNQGYARLNLQLAELIVEELNRINRSTNSLQKWYLILDRFGDEGVSIKTVELIQCLAKVCTGELYEQESKDILRMVLLGFNASIENYMDRVDWEEIQAVTHEDLKRYFKRYSNFKRVELDQNAISMMATMVLQKDPGDIPERTSILAKWALRIAEKIG